MVWKSRGIALGALLLMLFASWCRADIPPDVVARAKQSMALVEVEEKGGISEGSAFCIDATGLFVTNAHVVSELKGGGRLTLMLRSGEKDQTKVNAHLLAVDNENDLAILQVVGPIKVVPLTLGSNDGPIGTKSIAAFGYPFDTERALKDGGYPGITVSTGNITARRKINGELAVIQLDVALNPGNSGGPVLDSKGDVIGIIEEGIPGPAINNAIPVAPLRTLLARTRVASTPPAATNRVSQKVPDNSPYLLNPANGHWYGAVAIAQGLSWKQAEATAKELLYQGRHGHLVTVTSAEESDFVIKAFPQVIEGKYWMGAYKDTEAPDYKDPAAGWHWVTGEPWQYTNWNRSEPNGDKGGPHSDFLQFTFGGRWNDEMNLPPNHLDVGKGFIVEFEP